MKATVRLPLVCSTLALGSALDDPSNAPAAPIFDYLSWLGVPLIASGRVIGVIALEKSEVDFYCCVR